MEPREYRALAAERPELHAYIRLCEDGGDEAFGVAVKDVIDVRGIETTAGAPSRPPPPPAQDAPVVAAIRRAGGGIVGKTNLHEWAMGLTSDNPTFGRVGNPRYPTLTPGGSSGGSAAAVAAGLCDWALGTDTGGSIRIPAAACGIVGLKPTIGYLSTDGSVQVSESLDTIGPLARTVPSAREALRVLAGESNPAGAGRYSLVRPSDEWIGPLDPAIARMWEGFSSAVPEVGLPDRTALTQASWTILVHEAYRFHQQRLERTPSAFSSDVRRVLEAGMQVDSDAYTSALFHARHAAAIVDEILADEKILATPATAIVPPGVGQQVLREPLTRFSRPFNGTGSPALCVPLSTSYPPVGLQLVAASGRDFWLLDAAEDIVTARLSRAGGILSWRP